jgi:hypothetical protein
MKYVLLIYQDWTGISNLSEDDTKAIGAEYGALNKTPGVTPDAFHVENNVAAQYVIVRLREGAPGPVRLVI